MINYKEQNKNQSDHHASLISGYHQQAYHNSDSGHQYPYPHHYPSEGKSHFRNQKTNSQTKIKIWE